MRSETKHKLLRWLGYIIFFSLAFVYFIYKTFPYKQLVDRLTAPMQKQAQIRINAEDLRPYWFSGIEAQHIELRKAFSKGIATLHIEYLRAHTSLWSLISRNINASVEARLAGGQIKAKVLYKLNSQDINSDIKIENLRLAGLGPRTISGSKKKQSSLLQMLFAPVYGTLNASVQLKSESSDAPQPPADQTKKAGKAAPVRRPTAQRGIDIQKLNGNLKIRIRNLLIGPGYFPTPQMGELPVPLLRLGTLALDLKIANGVANITKCAAVGQDGELHFTGSIQLRPDLRYSVLQGTLRFKIDKAFAEGPDTPDMLKLGIQALGSPKGDGFFHFQLRLPFSGQQPSFRQQ